MKGDVAITGGELVKKLYMAEVTFSKRGTGGLYVGLNHSQYGRLMWFSGNTLTCKHLRTTAHLQTCCFTVVDKVTW